MSLILRSILRFPSLAPFAWRLAQALVTGRTKRCLFDPQGELEVAQGLDRPVAIRRDLLGVPYISAANWADAALAIGFCHGCDRLAQLDLLRRLVSGRLAEVIGRLALPLDVAARMVGYRRLAEDYAQRIDAETAGLLRAYADGVNEAIRRRAESNTLPVEYAIFHFAPQPWTLMDSLTVSRAACTDVTLASKPLLTLVAAQADASLRRLILPFALDPAPAASASADAGPEAGWGSNAWAVAGSRTEDGKPMVGADPHVGIQAPSIWYAARAAIEATGECVVGLTVPGWPFFVLGRNRGVAWGAANMLAEAADLFREKIEGDRYVSQGRRRALVVRHEEIPVRGLGKVRIPVRRTHRGTIVSDSALLRRLLGAGRDTHVSLAWPAESIPSDELTTFYRINRARNLDEFAQALGSHGMCALTFIAADADGRIGQFPAAAVPVRNSPPQGLIYDGTTARHDWRGVSFPSALPSCVDPPEGFLGNSNDLPSGCRMSVVGPLTCPPYRGDRMRALLAEAQRLSTAQAGRIQRDCLCLFTRRLIEALRPLLDRPTDATSRRAWELLSEFDGQMEADLAPAAVAGVYSEFLRRRVFGALLGPKVGARFAGNYHSYPAVFDVLDARPADERKDIASVAFADTVKYLVRHQGPRPDQWRWGKVVRVAPVTPLGRVPILGRKFRIPPCPGRGTAHTVSQARFRFDPRKGSQGIDLGVTARLLMPLGRDAILACIGTGQNESPASRHFHDQFDLLREGRYGEIHLADLSAESSESSLHLRPAGGAPGPK